VINYFITSNYKILLFKLPKINKKIKINSRHFVVKPVWVLQWFRKFWGVKIYSVTKSGQNQWLKYKPYLCPIGWMDGWMDYVTQHPPLVVCTIHKKLITTPRPTLDGVQGPDSQEQIWTHLKQIESLRVWTLPWTLALHLGSPNHKLFFWALCLAWFESIDLPSKMVPCGFSHYLPLKWPSAL
jgi:hypothetical protein